MMSVNFRDDSRPAYQTEYIHDLLKPETGPILNSLIFNIPFNQSARRVESYLNQHLQLRLQVDDIITRTYLDTYDWRIYENGDVLEAATDNTGLWLTWRSLGAVQVHARCPIDYMPRFVWNLKGTGLRTRLKKILDVRALLPVAAVSSRTRILSVLNNQNKTMLRIEIQIDYPYAGDDIRQKKSSTIIAKRIHLFPVKGYKKIIGEVCNLLKQEYNLAPVVNDPLVSTLTFLGITPGKIKEPPLHMDPRQRADISVKNIFLRQLDHMEKNEFGIYRDIDSEFLHDFRVAVRRTRALLGQVNGILPYGRIKRFIREFAWLGGMTGPARDMDVYLLSFDSYKSSLPVQMRKNLTPLYEYLCRHKQLEYSSLLKVIGSARYARLKQDWRKFNISPPPLRTTLEYADRPAIDVVNKRIWRIYRKALKRGDIITVATPPSYLHDLRKTCKKLRYMMEFFRDFYPVKIISGLISNLKVLQDNLGAYQDLKVQEEALRNFILGMEHETGITPGTREAINVLVSISEKRELEVRAEFAEIFNKFASPTTRKLYKRLFAS